MYIYYNNINNYSLKEYINYYNELSDYDKNKIDKLIITRKKQSILARILLKNILKNKYNINYKDMIIKYNKYGKPFIDNISFNISHSHDYVIVATSNKNIGIDIEMIRDYNPTSMNLFCTDNEIKYINNNQNKKLAYWKIYTLKEAYFKMLGTNLSNMKNVEFNILKNKITCVNNENLKIFVSTDINNYIFSIIYE